MLNVIFIVIEYLPIRLLNEVENSSKDFSAQSYNNIIAVVRLNNSWLLLINLYFEYLNNKKISRVDTML